MRKVTFTITEDTLVALWGEDAITNVAKTNGYRDMVANPDYIAAVGAEKIVDPEWVKPEDFDDFEDETPLIDNPDYVPAVGELKIPNPNETDMEFVAKIMVKNAIEKTAKGSRGIVENEMEKMKKLELNKFDQAVQQVVESAEIVIE